MTWPCYIPPGKISSGNWTGNFSGISVQFSSFTKSCPTLCNSMNCSTPGPPVHHQLPEFTQTHVHRVGDAIQPSHPLSSPSPALNLSQHHGLFKWVSSLHQVAKVLEFQLQHQCFQRTCYSAIKRNAFESVLMRWVNLEPIIQSEGSQKEI